MKITQVAPFLKRVLPPANGGLGLVVRLLADELVIRTRDDDL
jgi:hypothetical protein